MESLQSEPSEHQEISTQADVESSQLDCPGNREIEGY